MKRILRILMLVLSVLAIPLHPVQAQDAGSPTITITQIDTSNFPLVTVYISVTDASSKPMSIDPSQLRLFENGTAVTSENIRGKGAVEALTALLVVDTSGSMAIDGKLEGAQNAATQFVDRMRENDLTGLLAFNIKSELVAPISNDPTTIRHAIAELAPSENTAMYDALVEAEDILNTVSGRKAIIALTDGLDNRSQHTLEEVIENITSGGLSISIIGLGNPTIGPDDVSALDQPALEELANRAGGVYSYAEDASALQQLYASLQLSLQSEYAITYTSSVPLRDGVTRSLTVTLASGSTGQSLAASSYNPGGLIPEVGKAVSWPLFGIILGCLIVLLFIPAIIQLFHRTAPSKKKNSRIKLLD
jgi:VWFA-related protein